MSAPSDTPSTRSKAARERKKQRPGRTRPAGVTDGPTVDGPTTDPAPAAEPTPAPAPAPAPAPPAPAPPAPEPAPAPGPAVAAAPATPPDFDALYHGASTRLVRQAYLLTGSRRRAVGCVHRAFELAWANWPQVAADRSPEGWVRGAVFELAASPWHQLDLRHGRRSPAEPADRAGLTLDDRILLKALLQLSRARRRALVLHDVVGLDWKQTSTELESTTPMAYARVAHARQQLAEAAPTIVGADAGQPGFGRRLGALLQAAADRACPAAPSTGQAEQAEQLRHRSMLREWGTAAGAGLLSAVTAGGLAAALIWGTPMHPPAPAFMTYDSFHAKHHPPTPTPASVPRPTASPTASAPPAASAAAVSGSAPAAVSGAAVSGAAVSGLLALLPHPGSSPARTPHGRNPQLTARVPGAPADGASTRPGYCPVFALPCWSHLPRGGTTAAPLPGNQGRGSRSGTGAGTLDEVRSTGSE